MQRVALLNGKNKNQDYDLSKIFEALAYPGVIDGLEVSENSVSAWAAFIQVSRNGKNFNILYTAEEAVTIDTSWTKKVWVRINQANVNNGITNNPTGTEIGVIEVWAEFPSTDSYISLADIVDWVITDARQFVRGKGRVREDLPINSIIFIDSEWTEKYIEVDPALDDGKSLIIDATNWLRLESPTLNINDLTPTTSLTPTDKFIVSTSEGNKSVEASDALNWDLYSWIAWETIVVWDLCMIQNSDLKVYKFSNSRTWIIIWFSKTNASINNELVILTSWVYDWITSMTQNTLYYPWESATWVTNSSIVWITWTTNDGWTNSLLWYNATINKKWQMFIIWTDRILRSIEVRLWKNWSPTDQVQCKLFANNRSTLIAEATNKINWTSLSTTPTPQTFNFDDIVLEENTQYFYELSRTSFTNTNNRYSLDYTTSAYTWGNGWRDNSWTWVQLGVRFSHTIQMWSWTMLPITQIPNSYWSIGIAIQPWLLYISRQTLNWELTTSATTGSVALWNAVWFVTTTINWVPRKIPYYNI